MSADNFPTATMTRTCLRGEDCTGITAAFLGRTALMYGGLRLVGAKRPGVKALAASTAVQLFVIGWLATRGNEKLPSGIAARDGNPASIAYTYAGRSAIAALGMYAVGTRKGLVKEALAAVAPVEVAVLVWGSAS